MKQTTSFQTIYVLFKAWWTCGFTIKMSAVNYFQESRDVKTIREGNARRVLTLLDGLAKSER